MINQILHTLCCNISGEVAGEIWHWSLLGVKGLGALCERASRRGPPSRPFQCAHSSCLLFFLIFLKRGPIKSSSHIWQSILSQKMLQPTFASHRNTATSMTTRSPHDSKAHVHIDFESRSALDCVEEVVLGKHWTCTPEVVGSSPTWVRIFPVSRKRACNLALQLP